MQHDLYGGQKKIWITLRNTKRSVNEEVQMNIITPENAKRTRRTYMNLELGIMNVAQKTPTRENFRER